MKDKKMKKLNMIDTLTLEYLADGYRTITEKEKPEIISIDDIKFYRKRINNMLRENILELIKNNGEKVAMYNNTIDTLLFNIVKAPVPIFILW